MKYFNSMGKDITETVTGQFNGLNLIKLDLQQTIEQKEQQITTLTNDLNHIGLVNVELREQVESLESQVKQLKKRKRRKPNVN